MGRTILLVADDAEFCSVLCELLHDDGYEVVTAGSLHAALELARERNPDLVLLDIVLPDARELPAISAIRASIAAPVVAMTGLPRDTLARDLPVEAVLFKPFDLKDLHRFLPCRAGAVPVPSRPSLVGRSAGTPQAPSLRA